MQSTRDRVRSGRIPQGEAMVAALRVITLSIDSDQRLALVDISRVADRGDGSGGGARMTIAYLDTPSAFVVARQIGVSQTVTRCLERATELGGLAALHERPRAGREVLSGNLCRSEKAEAACAITLRPPH